MVLFIWMIKAVGDVVGVQVRFPFIATRLEMVASGSHK